MTASFPVVDATDWPVHAFEADGADEKVWLKNPDAGVWALFKPNARNDTDEQADHWPEKVVSEIARLIGVPAACTDLAYRAGRRGCLSYDVKPTGWELQPGWLLLAQLLGEHDPMDREHRGHTLANIHTVLAGYGPPPGFTGPETFDTIDVFAGYLVLDALVSNRDRHPSNWAVLRGPADGDRRLSPSYDHATSLGFNLTDAQREATMRDGRRWEGFLRRGTAHRFEGGRKTTLVVHAIQALSNGKDATRKHYLDQLRRLERDSIMSVMARVPEMSDTARTFAARLVDTNRRRLLGDY